MTRILALTNFYPPHYLGGYELSCRDVMERLAGRGHAVRVLTTSTRLEGVDDEPHELERGIHRDLAFYWDDHRLVDPGLGACVAIERANQSALARHLDEHRPEVVSVWNMGAMSLGMLTTVLDRGIPMVLNVCDDWLVYGPSLDPWSRRLRRAPVAAVARRVAGVPGAPRRLEPDVTICFVSEYVRDRAAAESRLVQGVAASTVVYSGIDHGDFPVQAPAVRPWRGRLLYVGRFEERKGVFTAVDALRELPADHQLDLVGRGGAEVEQRLRDAGAAGGLDGRVQVASAPRAELREIYSAADAFLFTSEWAEPFGLTPVEAMACGTPVIATGTGGSAEFLVDGFNCLRYPPGDPSALAAAIRRLSSDADLRGRLVAGGRTTRAGPRCGSPGRHPRGVARCCRDSLRGRAPRPPSAATASELAARDRAAG